MRRKRSCEENGSVLSPLHISSIYKKHSRKEHQPHQREHSTSTILPGVLLRCPRSVITARLHSRLILYSNASLSSSWITRLTSQVPPPSLTPIVSMSPSLFLPLCLGFFLSSLILTPIHQDIHVFVDGSVFLPLPSLFSFFLCFVLPFCCLFFLPSSYIFLFLSPLRRTLLHTCCTFHLLHFTC